MEVTNMKGAKAFWLPLWQWIRTAVPRSINITYVVPRKEKPRSAGVW
jgi:hypothetical protein